VKKKDEDISALKKLVKLPPTLHPQTEGVAQQRKDQDVVAMLLALHKRLVETEGALETALKQKEGEQMPQPSQPVINIEVTPQIIIPPLEQTAEAGPSTSAPEVTEKEAAAEQVPSLSMQNMMKEVQALEAHMVELKDAKEKLAQLEEKYDKFKQQVVERTREVRALEKRIKELEKELTMSKVITEVKKILWAKIGQSITDKWQYIETIHDQMDLLNRAQAENQRARASLGSMPEIANRMINVLNNRTGLQLATMGIRDRTDTILLIKRVLTLRNYVQTLERKCQDIQAEVNVFVAKIKALHGRGLPSLITSAGRLLPHEQYAKRVNNYATNQITTSASTREGAGPPSGQELYDKLENLFFIEHEIKHLFEVPPNYYKYTEADETLIKMQRHQMPTEDWWRNMIETLL